MLPQTLSRVNNQIGTFPGIDQAPPTGSGSHTTSGDMAAAELADPSNWVDLTVEARLGGSWVEVARWSDRHGGPWQGGPGKAAPALTYAFPVNSATRQPVPPARVRGVLLNGVRGAGSAAVCGLLDECA